MIEARDLAIEFKFGFMGRGRARPIDGFDLVASDGEAMGLVGPNGAGKTTFFKACAGLVKPARGRVLLDGIDPCEEPERARDRLTLMPERPGIAASWTGREAVEAQAAILGMGRAEARLAVERESARWGIESFWERTSHGYSRGQQVRVSLARAALRPAENVILDEPTAGLDFEGAALARSWVAELALSGRCVLVATHIVFEIQAMCHRKAGLRGGRAWSSEAVDAWLVAASPGAGSEPSP